MKTRFRCFVLAMLVASAVAMATSLDGPRLGMVYDPALRALRPILGIPGAAVMGEPF